MNSSKVITHEAAVEQQSSVYHSASVPLGGLLHS
jgi:hypothetical protein